LLDYSGDVFVFGGTFNFSDMINETIVTDRHPVKFKSWNDFMSDLHGKVDLMTNKVEFREQAMIGGETTIYRYSLDYIKARAYDEFFEGYLKINFDPYEDCQASYIISQIDNILSYKGSRI
jgi:hypothetical protein